MPEKEPHQQFESEELVQLTKWRDKVVKQQALGKQYDAIDFQPQNPVLCHEITVFLQAKAHQTPYYEPSYEERMRPVSFQERVKRLCTLLGNTIDDDVTAKRNTSTQITASYDDLELIYHKGNDNPTSRTVILTNFTNKNHVPTRTSYTLTGNGKFFMTSIDAEHEYSIAAVKRDGIVHTTDESYEKFRVEPDDQDIDTSAWQALEQCEALSQMYVLRNQ